MASRRIAICDFRMEFVQKIADNLGEQRHVTLGRMLDTLARMHKQGRTVTGLGHELASDND